MSKALPFGASAAMNETRELPDVEMLQAALQRYCLSLTASVWDAEDLAQHTWVKALKTLLGPGHRNAEAYLLRIVKHTWIDQCRRNRLQKQKMLLQEQQKVTETDGDPFGTEQAFEVLARRLTPLQRVVFLLRDIFGYSNEETSQWLQTTEGAVKSLLHRARQALEAARCEQQAGEVPERADEGLRSLALGMADAYRREDLQQLVMLARQDILPPVAAFAAVQRRLRRENGLQLAPQQAVFTAA